MISEERLKELKKRNKEVYFILGNNKIIELKDYQFIVACNCIKAYSDFYISYNNLYETKEEAEFVAKYHCSKTIKFEPPTFEEFMEREPRLERMDNVLIRVIDIDKVIVVDKLYYFENNTTIKYFEYSDEQSQAEAYYQAVEYAKKLFLGEEE